MDGKGRILKMAGDSYFDYAKIASDASLHDMQSNKLRFDMEKELPADTSAADSLEKLAQGWGQNRRGMEGGIQAMFLGLAAGMKGAANKEKRERMERFANVAGYMESQNNSMKEMLEKKKKETIFKEAVSPLANDLYMSMAMNIPEGELMKAGQLSLKTLQDKGLAPQGAELTGVSRESRKLIYNDPKTGQEGVFSILPYVTEEGHKAVDDFVKTKNADARTMSAEASKLRAEDDHTYRPQELGIRKQEATNARYRTIEIAAKRHEKLLTEVTPKIEASKRMVVVTERMKSIAKSHSDIFQNILHDVWAAPQGSEEGIATLWKKKATDDATARAISNMVKYSSELKADMFKTLSPKGMNIFSEKILAASSPDHKMQSDAFFDTLDDVNRHAQDSLELHLERLKETQGILGEESNLADFYERNADKYIEGERTHNEMTPEGKPNENYGKPKNSVDTGATTSNPNKGSGNVHIYKAPDGKGGFKEWNLTPEQYNAIPEEKRGKLKMVR